MIIRCKNDLTEKAQKSFLSNSVSLGTTILGWKNPNAFQANWAIQLGETGEERSEIKLLGADTPAGTAGTISAGLSFDHPADTPIYAIKWDQIVFECATAGTSGTASPLTDGTINIAPDAKYTQFDHTAGSVGYGYRTYYRSSGLAVNSIESDWLTSAGYSFYSLAKIRERAKSKAQGEYSDDDWNDWVNEWMEKMNNAAIDINEDYRIGTVDVAFSGTAQYGTIPGTCNFKAVRRAWYTENGSDWAQMTKQEYVDFHPSETFDETHPYYHMKGDDELGRNPHDSSGTARLSFYKLNTTLSSDTDELPVPMRGYTGSFIKWATAQSYRKDGMIAEATGLESQVEGDLERFKSEMSPRNKSGPTYIDIVEEVGVDDAGGIW